MQIVSYSLANRDEWDQLILGAEHYSFFHSMAWAKAMVETYGFQMNYVACYDKNDFAAIPIMIVHDPIQGTRGICLPFSDCCGPVYTNRCALDLLVRYVLQAAGRHKWRELRLNTNCGIPELTPRTQYYEHVVPLNRGTDEAFRALRSSTRRNIQRAEREGVEVDVAITESAMDVYYRLHCITRKRLGVPPQSRSFFRNLQTYVLQPGNGVIIRAHRRGKTVAAAVFLHFGKMAVYKYGASLPDYQHVRPSNLVVWKAIAWYTERGFSTLSLGRTDPNDSGLMQFKNGWGGESSTIDYCAWPASNHGQKFTSIGLRVASPFVKAMPIPILRLIGNVAYRFFP